MVCVPCFIIPVLLYIWHKFVQPIMLRYWNPWSKKDGEIKEAPEFPFECKGGVCPYPGAKKKLEDKDKKSQEESGVSDTNTTTTTAVGSKKDD